MTRRRYRHSLALTALAAAVMSRSAGGAEAAAPSVPGYQIQAIARLGDTVAGVKLDAGGYFQIGTLNDHGQLVFGPSNAHPAGSEALIFYSDGQFTPIVAAGQPGPLGNWPKDVGIAAPVSMNQQGRVVFSPARLIAGLPSLGVFRWDPQDQQLTAIALKGMPAVNNLSYADPGGGTPTINNRDEIAFIAGVENAAGKVAYGIFFHGREGPLEPVALPDQALPDGGTAGSAFLSYLSLNDAGVVGFLLQRRGEKANSGYLWEKGVITPVARVGQEAPGGGKFAAVSAVRVNNRSRTAVVAARLMSGGPDLLYRYANGQLMPVALPGQPLPGGGTFKALQVFVPNSDVGVSLANEAGQHVILAQITDGGQTRTAAYRLDPDGTLSLILKSGMTTDLGVISVVGTGPVSQENAALNSQGQAVMTVRFRSGPETMVLLTPMGP